MNCEGADGGAGRAILGESRKVYRRPTGLLPPPYDAHKNAQHKSKSPEAVLISLVSASSSLLPVPTACPLSMRTLPSDLCSGSGLTANRMNRFNASGL